MLHVNIIMLYVDIKSRMNINMLHVDIIYLNIK